MSARLSSTGALSMMAGLLLGILFAFPAQAHKVNLFAYVEGERVHTESYFADGGKCSHATIMVYDHDDELLLEGETDEQGLFDFPLPETDELRIVVEASMGHRSEYLLSTGETREADNLDATAADLESQTSPAASPSTQAMEDLLDRKLAPLVASLQRLRQDQQRARFRDVIGGLGYIVGLMGLFMYLRSRKRSD